MFKIKFAIAAVSVAVLLAGAPAAAQEFAPYGTAKAGTRNYSPMKFVIESSTFEPPAVADAFRIAGQALANSPAGSQATVVVIGPGIRIFAKENYEKYQAIVERAAELIRDKGVKVVYCGESTKGAGYEASDLHGFGEVVPGGYVEIADLVGKGYVHIRPSEMQLRTRGVRYLERPELKK